MKRQTSFEKWLERAGYQHLRGVEGKDAVKRILRESFNAGRRSKFNICGRALLKILKGE